MRQTIGMFFWKPAHRKLICFTAPLRKRRESMYLTIQGFVLRVSDYGDHVALLTVLSKKHGKLTVKARGALRKGSKTAAATQQLTYSEMTLFGNRGRWTVNEASVREGFDGLRTDIGSFALGSYFA